MFIQNQFIAIAGGRFVRKIFMSSFSAVSKKRCKIERCWMSFDSEWSQDYDRHNRNAYRPVARAAKNQQWTTGGNNEAAKRSKWPWSQIQRRCAADVNCRLATLSLISLVSSQACVNCSWFTLCYSSNFSRHSTIKCLATKSHVTNMTKIYYSNTVALFSFCGIISIFSQTIIACCRIYPYEICFLIHV